MVYSVIRFIVLFKSISVVTIIWRLVCIISATLLITTLVITSRSYDIRRFSISSHALCACKVGELLLLIYSGSVGRVCVAGG